MIWSKLNEIDFMKQIGEEYPEIKLPMTSSDRKICHEQFDAMKHRQNPDTGLSIVSTEFLIFP